MTLHDLIETFPKQINNKDLRCYFSKSGNQIVGYILCRIERNEVAIINGYSSDINKNNTVLIRDYNRLIRMLLDQYEKIYCWVPYDYPTPDMYRKLMGIYSRIIKMFNGYSEEKDGRMYYYIKKSLV
jgi:hypothetical protein